MREGKYKADDRDKFEDVFVYIVSHGKLVENDKFIITIRNSEERPNYNGDMITENFIEFESLLERTFGTGCARLYFIVDACYSGAIHSHAALIVNPFAPPYELHSRDGRRAAALLSANSRQEPDLVLGRDKDKLPLFTECFLDTLRSGVEIGFHGSLSFSDLCHVIYAQCERKIDEREKSEPQFAKALVNIPDVSDRIGPYSADVQLSLSRIPIFPNNNPANVDVNFTLRRIRQASLEIHEKKAEWKRIEAASYELKSANIRLDTTNRFLTGQLEESSQRITELMAAIERDKGEAERLLGEKNRLEDQIGEASGRIVDQQAETNCYKSKVEVLVVEKNGLEAELVKASQRYSKSAEGNGRLQEQGGETGAPQQAPALAFRAGRCSAAGRGVRPSGSARREN